MAGNESLFNKMDDANRRREEEEADARKPYLAMLERERQTKERDRELAAQAAAQNEAEHEALLKVAWSVNAMNAMNTFFNDQEKAMLRFLKAEFLLKGEKPQTMVDTDKAILNKSVMARFNMAHSEYVEMMTRFRALGIVDFNGVVMAVEAQNGLLHVKPYIVEVVRQIDEEDQRKKEQPVNLVEKAKGRALSNPWIAIPVIVIVVVVWIINQFKPILEMFSHKK